MVNAIIQARMSSRRLPNKVLMEINGETVLTRLLTRLKKSGALENITVATSENNDDDLIEKECQKNSVPCFRGSLDDVLGRFYYCAKENNYAHILRICADSPLLDVQIIDNMIAFYCHHDFDIVKAVQVPLGLGAEIFSFAALEKAFIHGREDYHREHVTPYMYENCKTGVYSFPKDYSHYRFTLDTKEDLELITQVFKRIPHENFHIEDVVSLMKQQPCLYEINKNVEQTKIILRPSDSLQKG